MMGYRSRFLADKTVETSFGPIHTNEYEQKWLARIPPEYRTALRVMPGDKVEEFFDLLIPEVPKQVRFYCYIHA